MKTASKILKVVGIILIVLTVISVLGNLSAGKSLPYPIFGSSYITSYTVGLCIGAYGPGILGLICLIVSRFLWNEKKEFRQSLKKKNQ